MHLSRKKKLHPDSDFKDIWPWLNHDKFDKLIVLPDLDPIFNEEVSIWEELNSIIKYIRNKIKLLNQYQIKKIEIEVYGRRLIEKVRSPGFAEDYKRLPPHGRMNIREVLSTGINRCEATMDYVLEGLNLGEIPNNQFHFFHLSEIAHTYDYDKIVKGGTIGNKLILELSEVWNISLMLHHPTIHLESKKRLLNIIGKKSARILDKAVQVFDFPSDFIEKLTGWDPKIDDLLESVIKKNHSKFKKGIQKLPAKIKLSAPGELLKKFGGILNIFEFGITLDKLYKRPKDLEALADLGGIALEILKFKAKEKKLQLTNGLKTGLTKGPLFLGVLSSMIAVNSSAKQGDGAGLIGNYIMGVGGAIAFMGLGPVGLAASLLGLGVTFLKPKEIELWVRNCFFGKDREQFRIDFKNLRRNGPQKPYFVFF